MPRTFSARVPGGVAADSMQVHFRAPRRAVLRALGAGLLAAPLSVVAQTGLPLPRIGYLSQGTPASNRVFLDALKDGLRELGWIDGRNFVLDLRFVGIATNLFPQEAAALAKAHPHTIVTTCIPSTRAAMGATRSIPVVMSIDGDPVKADLIASYARPGGNVTGTSTLFEELIPKWLELLALATPAVRDVAVLGNPANPVEPFFWARFEDAARQRGLRVLTVGAAEPAAIPAAFVAMKRQNAGALVVMTDAFLAGQIATIVPLANRAPLPAIYGYREFAAAGGLMSYGLSYRDYFRRVARYVDAVLKGAKPADLPVEQPTQIELVVNLQTARALGLAVPQSLLLRADEVIQ